MQPEKRPLDVATLARMLSHRHDDTEMFYAMLPWGTAADGYKQAGDLLADTIAAKHPYDSPLVFPMLFCYRHYVELCVKELIHTAQPILIEPFSDRDFAHRLEPLLSRLNAGEWRLLELMTEVEEETEEHKPTLRECVDVFRDVCTRFANADPDSYRYRYPISKKKKNLGEIEVFESHPYPKLMEELKVRVPQTLKELMSTFALAVGRIGSVIAAISDSEQFSSNPERKPEAGA